MPGEKKKPVVLVVDDDATLRMMLRASLEQGGFSVLEAEGGAKGVAMFAESQPDLVLLDVMMPGMNGLQACAAMRRLPGCEHTPVLMLTGLEDVDSINRAFEAGATDFITKPVNWPMLTHRLRYMLRARSAIDALAESQRRLATAQRIAKVGNCEWKVRDQEMHWSDEVYRILGLDRQQQTPSCAAFTQLIHPDDRARIEELIRLAETQAIPFSADLRLTAAHGSPRCISLQAEIECDPGGAANIIHATFQDITERKVAEEQIRSLAFYDSLTGLPNRRLFKQQLEHSIAMAKRNEKMLVTLALDLDQFKRINDTLGHDAGDQLLQEVAKRLLRCLRESDRVTRSERVDYDSSVARLGGDEFNVLLNDVADLQNSSKVARRIIESVALPITVAKHEVFVTSSIGIAVYPSDGKESDTLLQNADAAMYHAKQLGGNTMQFYSQSMNAAATQTLALENSLRKALERNEFVLYFQPQIQTLDGSIVGVEALVRWQHPVLGLLRPQEFLAVAEQSGLMAPISDWVLRTACNQNMAWQRAGLPAFPVAVNTSNVHFAQENFVASVIEALQASGLAPRYLELEITEDVLTRRLDEALPKLKQLKMMGVRLSIDDFGTGYSSLSRLKRLPLDKLKIDQSFVHDITTDVDDAAITTAVIAMASSLRLGVIAEGVENEQQMKFLRDHGCNEMQGYLFSEALPPERLELLLRAYSNGDKGAGFRFVH